MQLLLEHPDYAYLLHRADGRSAQVNGQRLRSSFIVSTRVLVEQWAVHDVRILAPGDLEPLWALGPEVILLGSGEVQAFPPPETLAACLKRGIGLEAMTNAAAARTFNVLAGEGRQVVAGFILAAEAPDPEWD